MVTAIVYYNYNKVIIQGVIKMINQKTSFKIAFTGLMVALVFLGTFTIKIPTPLTSGYIHLGDAFVLLSGLILGPIYGALAAGLGSAMADIFGGYAHWALPTFLIKGLMAALMGYITLKKDNKKVILMMATAFSLFWFGFNYLLRLVLIKEVPLNTQYIANELGLPEASELYQLSGSLQDKLLLAALFIPVILVVILVIINKTSKLKIPFTYSLGFIVSGAIMIVGYYVATYFIYGSYILPIFEIPMNMIQFIGGIIIAHLLLPIFQKLIVSKMQI